MKFSLILTVLCLLNIVGYTQNGTYQCKRQAYKAPNPLKNTETTDDYTISIHVIGVGGDDYVKAKIIDENADGARNYNWKVTEELRMSPAAREKKTFKSYRASLIADDNETDGYQISVIKSAKEGYFNMAVIDVDGGVYWFYDLKKIK